MVPDKQKGRFEAWLNEGALAFGGLPAVVVSAALYPFLGSDAVYIGIATFTLLYAIGFGIAVLWSRLTSCRSRELSQQTSPTQNASSDLS